jgi:flagellar hook-associated protein 1 FlgK
MGLDSALLNSTSGLRHVSRQIAQSSHNIANASTSGYSAKRVQGEAVSAGGVRTLDASRDVDEALRAEARVAQGNAAAASLRDGVLAPLAQIQGNPELGNSVGDLLGALRDAFVALRAAPSDAGVQDGALRAADEVASRMREIAGAVGRSRQSVQDTLRADVDSANSLLREVARLDGQVRATAAAGRSDADVLDRRDAAVARLSDLLELTPVPTSDGGVTLILRGGSVLPLDATGSPLSIDAAPVSPDAYWGTPAGTLPGVMLNGLDISASLKGGRIGAELELRDRTLPLMQAELDLTAATLAKRLDDQGLRLFTDGGAATAPPDATAGYAGAVIGFAGRIAISRDVGTDPTLLRDGTHASALTGFTPNPAGGPSGFAELVDAVLDQGFGTSATAGGPLYAAIPSDRLGPGGNLASGFAPPRRITDYAAAFTASQGAVAAEAADRAVEAKGIRTRMDGLLQRREGVDVDQEMASLLQLQNAYAANARVMGAVQEMWDALLASVR